MELVTIKKFINVMRNYPEIYAVGQRVYKNIYKKEMAWRKIKEKMGIDVKKLKIKWRNLRDTYIKHKYCLRSGKGSKNLSNWVWANEMSFIEPYVKLKAIDNEANVSVISNDSEGNTEENEEQDGGGTNLKKNESIEPETQNIKRRPPKRRRKRDANPAVNVMTNINPEVYTEKGPDTVVEVPCDRTDMEFLGYANTMKKLSLRSQALIKLQITKILTQYQLEELSPTTPVCNEDGSSTTVQLRELQSFFIDFEEKHTPDTK